MPLPIHNPRGMALIIVLMLFAVLSVVSLWALNIAELNRKTAENQVRGQQAFSMAEAGVAYALAAIRENPLWRPHGSPASASESGRLRVGGLCGSYCLRVQDGGATGRGGGRLRLLSEGCVAESRQSLSCVVELSPSESHVSNSPKISVVAAGKIEVAGAAVPVGAYDTRGGIDPGMLAADAPLPRVNQAALKALADDIVSDLNNRVYADRFSHRHGFWRKGQGTSRAHITWVKGDLILSGDRRLFGVFLVEGRTVRLSGKASLRGVLYAPNASSVTLPADTVTPRVMGQVLAGGGVKSPGDRVSVQLVEEYVDEFNDVAGDKLQVSIRRGSWCLGGETF